MQKIYLKIQTKMPNIMNINQLQKDTLKNFNNQHLKIKMSK